MYLLIGGWNSDYIASLPGEMRQLYLRACTEHIYNMLDIYVLHALNGALHVSISTAIYRVIVYEGVAHMHDSRASHYVTRLESLISPLAETI